MKEIGQNSQVHVIKKQQIRSTIQWTEKEILNTIYQGGPYPSVVWATFFDQDPLSAGL